MIRSHDLYFHPDLSYRSPATTPNQRGYLSAHVDLTTHFPASDNVIGPALEAALTAVTSSIQAAAGAVESDSVGQEVKRLRKQLFEARAAEVEAAAKVSDLSKRRSEDLRAGKTTSPEKIRVARGQHVSASELVVELTGLLADAETRLDEETQAARVEAIAELTKQARIDLEKAERAASESILTTLAPVYVAASVLRDLSRRYDSARTPKPTPQPPMVFPDSTAGHKPVKGSSPYDGDGPRRQTEADDDLGILGPVEVTASF